VAPNEADDQGMVVRLFAIAMMAVSVSLAALLVSSGF
jgi:hypothetical protein